MPPLRDQHLGTPHPRRLSPLHPRFVEIVALHSAAVAQGDPCYVDPETTLTVFTAAFLAERDYCCESGCRHCPFLIE